MRTQGGSPNLINGVSRQPQAVRLVSQLQESVNQFPTVSRGLVRRNPTIRKGALTGILGGPSVTHLIDRDASERYAVTVNTQDPDSEGPTIGLSVHTLNGTEKSVSFPDGLGYLEGATPESIRLMTVQDHTFVLNTRKVVQKLPDLTPSRPNEGLVHVVQGDYFSDYKVFINGDLKAHFRTNGGPFSEPADVRRAERGARPGMIAQVLATGMPTDEPDMLGTSYSNLRDSLPGAQWTISVLDSVIVIRNSAADFDLVVRSSSDTRLRAHKGESRNFSELPRVANAGFTLRISGSEENGFDDYYVKFSRGEGVGHGVWKETVAPEIQYKIDPATMPHLLVRNADGTFTFKQASWAARSVGDEDTSPWPSFVGARISGLAFGGNRLGLFSRDNIAWSRHGKYFNFWAESVLALLDTDPVDAGISYPEVSNVTHVVPFGEETIVFTTSVPFKMGGGDRLTQETVRFDALTANTAKSSARPVAAGSSLFYVNDTPSGSFVHEFSSDPRTETLKSDCITEHVTGYIPNRVFLMEADADLKLVALVSKDEPNSVFVYKWLWLGNEKAQSAWQKWDVGAPIQGLKFFGEELVLVVDYEERETVAINCHEAWLQGRETPVYLDRQVQVTAGAFSADLNETAVVLPYSTDGVVLVSVGEDDFGVMPKITRRASKTLYLDGDWSGKDFAAGYEYSSYGELSQILHRQSSQQGGSGNAVPGWRTSVGQVRFGMGASAFLLIDVDRDYRPDYTYSFSAAQTGSKTGSVGSLRIGEILPSITVRAPSEDLRITFRNSGPYPYSVLSYNWTGDARPVSY